MNRMEGLSGTTANSAVGASASAPTQVGQAESPMTMAREALADAGLDALSETMEEMSFTWGSRLREIGIKDEQTERSRASGMLRQLSAQVTAVGGVPMDDLLRRFAGLGHAGDVLGELRMAGLDQAQMLLLLSALLSEDALPGRRRQRLEAALASLMTREGWELELFCGLEFGVAAGVELTGLRQLYQRAIGREVGLAHWFEQFRRMRERRRALKALVRTLAFELRAGGGAMQRPHLGAVLGELKRLLLFLTLEHHCAEVAASLPLGCPDGDRIMAELLLAVEQSWMYPEWLAERLTLLGITGAARHIYGRRFKELLQALPDGCFSEDDQREHILDAITEAIIGLAD